jgi:hypothetical protein
MDRQAAWIVVYELILATPCPDCVRGYRAALPGRQSRPDTAGVDPGSVRECCAGRFWAVIDSRN